MPMSMLILRKGSCPASQDVVTSSRFQLQYLNGWH